MVPVYWKSQDFNNNYYSSALLMCTCIVFDTSVFPRIHYYTIEPYNIEENQHDINIIE